MRRRVIKKIKRLSGLPVLVDSKPLREDLLKNLKRKRRELDNLRKSIDLHDRQDAPQYAGWVGGTFGAQMERINKSVAEVSRMQEILDQVDWLRTYLGFSAAKALKIVDANDFWEVRKKFQEEHTSRDNRDDEPAWYDESDDGFFNEDNAFDGEPFYVNQAPKMASTELKSLYRSLALMLHPDVAPANDERRYTVLWHQLQDAYAQNDLDAMMRIRDSVSGVAKGGNIYTVMSISELMMQKASLEFHLAESRREVRTLKKLPSWNFVLASQKPKHLQKLHAGISASLKDQTIELQMIWGHLNERLEKLRRKKQARERSAGAKRRSRRVDRELFSW